MDAAWVVSSSVVVSVVVVVVDSVNSIVETETVVVTGSGAWLRFETNVKTRAPIRMPRARNRMIQAQRTRPAGRGPSSYSYSSS